MIFEGPTQNVFISRRVCEVYVKLTNVETHATTSKSPINFYKSLIYNM